MKKVLMIDDSPFMTQMFAIRLHEDGFEPIVAGTGQEGIDMAKREEPAVILLDIAMPGMTGWDVLTALKSEPKTKDTPVLILTNARGSEEDHERAKEIGAADFLMKTELKVDEILGVVKKFV